MNQIRNLKLPVILFFILFPTLIYAQNYLYIDGSIPLKEHRRPATDLVYGGQLKIEQELVELRKNGVDLSQINPRTDTSIWNDTIGGPLNPDDDNIGLNLSEPVEYMSSQRGRTGVFRITIRQSDANGNTKTKTSG